jgi:hypothetical protein
MLLLPDSGLAAAVALPLAAISLAAVTPKASCFGVLLNNPHILPFIMCLLSDFPVFSGLYSPLAPHPVQLATHSATNKHPSTSNYTTVFGAVMSINSSPAVKVSEGAVSSDMLLGALS